MCFDPALLFCLQHKKINDCNLLTGRTENHAVIISTSISLMQYARNMSPPDNLFSSLYL